jgi:hypothetical protein
MCYLLNEMQENELYAGWYATYRPRDLCDIETNFVMIYLYLKYKDFQGESCSKRQNAIQTVTSIVILTVQASLSAKICEILNQCLEMTGAIQSLFHHHNAYVIHRSIKFRAADISVTGKFKLRISISTLALRFIEHRF